MENPLQDEGKALTVAPPVSGALVALGTRREIREYARRIVAMAPGGMKLNGAEATTLAEYAVSLGANALVGEVWLLKNESSGEVLGVMPGMRLFRRRADEKDERAGDSRWVDPYPVDDPDERRRLGIPDDAYLAVMVRLYRQSQTKAYAELTTAMSKAGASWPDIERAAGIKPYITGVGYMTKIEFENYQKRRPGKSESKESPWQIVTRRAEKHALKQAYSLPFGFIALVDGAEQRVPQGAMLEDYIIEADFREFAAEDTRTPEERAEAGKRDAAALYDDPHAPPPDTPPDEGATIPAERVAELRKTFIGWGVLGEDAHDRHILNLVNLSPFGIGLNLQDPEVKSWFMLYRENRNKGMKAIPAAQAAQEVWSAVLDDPGPARSPGQA